VAFSPDGKSLASADANGAIQMWHTPAPGGDWIILAASALAIVLAALAVAMTARAIWRGPGGAHFGRKLWKSCWWWPRWRWAWPCFS
jgi:hypothetical protein